MNKPRTTQDLRVVTTDEEIEKQQTLVYNVEGGFTWVREPNNVNCDPWQDYFSTLHEALKAAQSKGFDPLAVYYPHQ